MTWTLAEESRIQALENDIAQLIEKVELNMTTKTEYRAKVLILELAIQELEADVASLTSQLNTLRDAYLGHGTGAVDHPPPTV